MFKITDAKVAIEDDAMVHVDLTDGGLRLSTWASNYALDDALDELVQRWDGEDEVAIEHRFTIPSIAADMIELHRIFMHKDAVVFASKDRPMVEAMRAQLVEAMALIDSIAYEAD